MLYACACGTGFRAGGLAPLTPECFDLDARLPHRHAAGPLRQVEAGQGAAPAAGPGRGPAGVPRRPAQRQARLARHLVRARRRRRDAPPRPGRCRHPLRGRGARRPGVRRLPQPAPLLPDRPRPVGGGPAGSTGTRRPLERPRSPPATPASASASQAGAVGKLPAMLPGPTAKPPAPEDRGAASAYVQLTFAAGSGGGVARTGDDNSPEGSAAGNKRKPLRGNTSEDSRGLLMARDDAPPTGLEPVTDGLENRPSGGFQLGFRGFRG